MPRRRERRPQTSLSKLSPRPQEPPHHRRRRPNPTRKAGCGDGSIATSLARRPRDTGLEKCREKPVEESTPARTDKASQQADPASSASKASPQKGKGRWRGEEGRDQKKLQSPSPPTPQTLPSQPRINNAAQDLQQHPPAPRRPLRHATPLPARTDLDPGTPGLASSNPDPPTRATVAAASAGQHHKGIWPPSPQSAGAQASHCLDPNAV
jgi:hypothetical protein